MKKLTIILMAMLLVVSTCLMAGCGKTVAYQDIKAVLNNYGGQINIDDYQQSDYDNVDLVFYYDPNAIIFHANMSRDLYVYIHVSADGEKVSFVCKDVAVGGYVVVSCDDDLEVEYVDVYTLANGSTDARISSTHEKYDQIWNSTKEHITTAVGYFEQVVCRYTNGKYCTIRQMMAND